MSNNAEGQPTPGAGSPQPIGEIETMIERTPPPSTVPVVRELTEVEPIGEVETMIERSSKPA
jgi:hypothetical protein